MRFDTQLYHVPCIKCTSIYFIPNAFQVVITNLLSVASNFYALPLLLSFILSYV